jgi:phosphoribosylamine-glycine ligase
MKILVLAGGADQIALIQELKSRGCNTVILVDYFENPPAKRFADSHIIASTLDVEEVKRIALSERVDLICTACTDQALLTVAKVSEELSLPCYIPYQTALNVTNKSYMKKVMKECDIPTSQYIILDHFDRNALKGFCYPLVVKPVDCNSSKGVKKVETEEELQLALDSAISYSRTCTAIIEEFKLGREISADFYIEGENVKYLCATSSAKIKNTHSFTIMQSYYPAITPEEKEELIRIAEQIVRAFHLKDTPLLVQLILKDNHFDVLEFSARMGGGSKYKLIEVLSGVNIMSGYVDLILGKKPIVMPSERVNYAVMNYVYCSPGVISGFEGFQYLKEKSLIQDYFLYKTIGMNIAKAETSGDRAAGYLVTALTEQELQEKVQYIDSQLAVLDCNGMDIMLHDLV